MNSCCELNRFRLGGQNRPITHSHGKAKQSKAKQSCKNGWRPRPLYGRPSARVFYNGEEV